MRQLLREMEISWPLVALSTLCSLMLAVVAYALFTGWNPDQLPYAIRVIQAVLGGLLSIVFLALTAIGIGRLLRQHT